MIGSLWSLVTFPFRLIGTAVEWGGRLLGAAAGFALMVGGVALCTGTLAILGIPVFVVGLVLTLRSLG